MTYAEVCVEIIGLGGVEIPSNVNASRAFVMPAPCLHLVALPDASGASVLAEAWNLTDDGERNYVTTFYAVDRDQVASMLPALTAQAQRITGEAA
jgi:hypothetical protein